MSRKYEELLNAFQSAAWMIDAASKQVMAVNSSYRSWFNGGVDVYTLDELVWNFIESVHPEDQPLLRVMLTRFIDDRQSFDIRCRYSLNDTYHTLNIRGLQTNSIKSADDTAEQRGVLVCVLDDLGALTETGAMRSEYRRHLDDVSTLKSAIIENIGHEFRTPVTAIMGFSDLLESRLSDELSTQYIGYIRNSSQRLLHTLESVLEYAVIYSGNHDVFETEFLLEDLLDEELLILQQKASEKGLYLQLDIQKNRRIKSDRKKLASILYRYADNAVKFTNNGGVRLKLVVNENQLLKIEVADTGKGIDSEKTPELFEPFRVGKANREVTRVGIGMGLSIVKRYAQVLGGKVWLTSNEHGGTTAHALVPITILNNPSSGSRKNDTRKRILYVEDNSILQLMMANAFPDVAVDKALNAEQALELITEYAYPLVFIDINLGSGMDGAQLCKYMRTLPDYNDALLIAATANYNFANRDILNRYGFDDFLLKPLNINAMRKLVEKVT